MDDRHSMALWDVFEMYADRPNRPPTRISDASATTIKEKLPRLRALIVNRSIMRMIREMVTNDCPRKRGDQTHHHLASRRPTPASAAPVRERSALIAMSSQPVQRSFDLPFSAQPLYGKGEVGDTSTLKLDELFAFPGMFDIGSLA
ncbi:hypothetical protein HZ326_17070 [Fusarium oxysporum f. sp. albedinis]|nr:hypothetical protein HZ326_17070 [Fusarium oxysporum f. sp. albedinis]